MKSGKFPNVSRNWFLCNITDGQPWRIEDTSRSLLQPKLSIVHKTVAVNTAVDWISTSFHYCGLDFISFHSSYCCVAWISTMWLTLYVAPAIQVHKLGEIVSIRRPNSPNVLRETTPLIAVHIRVNYFICWWPTHIIKVFFEPVLRRWHLRLE